MDDKGNFHEQLIQDINGLMSLYEASQLCMHGEEAILEEGASFTKQILHAAATDLDHHLARFVRHTLAHPHHRSPSAFMVKHYFGDNQWTDRCINFLQEVAKMDFNATQALRQKEFFQFSQWWKEAGLANGCEFARPHPLAWYVCSLAFFTDPCFSEERILLAKSISLIYIIDDIFDEYGTLDQLTLLITEAISRWDMTATEELPDSMKSCLAVLYEITNKMSDAVKQKHAYNPTESLRKTWAELCRAFLVEAEWFKSGHSPGSQEYLKNGIVSCGVPLGMVHAFFLLGQGLSDQTVELLRGYPDFVSSSAMILRLLDDMETTKGESGDGNDGSYARSII